MRACGPMGKPLSAVGRGWWVRGGRGRAEAGEFGGYWAKGLSRWEPRSGALGQRGGVTTEVIDLLFH